MAVGIGDVDRREGHFASNLGNLELGLGAGLVDLVGELELVVLDFVGLDLEHASVLVPEPILVPGLGVPDLVPGLKTVMARVVGGLPRYSFR